MNYSDVRILHGLSIATLVLSIVGIGSSLIGVGCMAIASVHFSSEDFLMYASSALETIIDSGSTSEIYTYELYDYGLSGLLSMIAPFFDICAAAFLIEAVLYVVPLVAALQGNYHCDEPENLGIAFGFSIAGAIVEFLLGNIVTCILLIVMCIYINRLRKTVRS